jgi:predicted DNA-binding transcriptional regulator AlpA
MAPEISQVNEAESVEAARAFRLVGISRITGWRLINNPDSGFPRPFRCDPTNPRSRLRIRVCELVQWIERQQRLTSEAGRTGIHADRRAPRAGVTA